MTQGWIYTGFVVDGHIYIRQPFILSNSIISFLNLILSSVLYCLAPFCPVLSCLALNVLSLQSFKLTYCRFLSFYDASTAHCLKYSYHEHDFLQSCYGRDICNATNNARWIRETRGPYTTQNIVQPMYYSPVHTQQNSWKPSIIVILILYHNLVIIR